MSFPYSASNFIKISPFQLWDRSTGVLMSLGQMDFISLGYILRSEIVGTCGSSSLFFWGALMMLSILFVFIDILTESRVLMMLLYHRIKELRSLLASWLPVWAGLREVDKQLPYQCRGKGLGYALLLSQAVLSRKLDQKWGSQDMNWCSYGMPKPQADS